MASPFVPDYQRPDIEDQEYTAWYCEHPTSVGPDTFPCGRCTLCLAQRTSRKATRVMLEAKTHPFSCDFTLTYRDENLPMVAELEFARGVLCDPENGIPTGRQIPSLSKRDIELFMKRLRKAVNAKYPGLKIRFILCGEYGSHRGRPHYHVVVFGVSNEDAALIESCWQLGHVHFGWKPLTAVLAMYISKHNMKPDLKGQGRDLHGREPEFTKASQGLGRGYVPTIAAAFESGAGKRHVEQTGDIETRVRQNGRLLPLDKYLVTKCREALGIPVLKRDRPPKAYEKREHVRAELAKRAAKIRRQLKSKDGKKL